jgi:tetratricopeptide (TPR) repeat protein
MHLAVAMALISAIAFGDAAAQSTPDQAARAERLNELFALLKVTKDQDEGDIIVADIWKVWLQSGSAELDGHMQEAIAQMALNQLPQALKALDLIVASAPQWAEAWNKRATVLYMMGEHDRSLADIERVLALEPRHFGALAGIGLIRMDKGELREALAAFRRALAVNPCLKERFGLIPMLEQEIGEKPL